MQLILDTDYWNQIEALDLDPQVKGQIKAMISAYQTKASPPTASNHVLRELAALNLTTIIFTDKENREHYLELTEFIPTDTERHRMFTYLRPCYPNGENQRLTPRLNTEAAGLLTHQIGSALQYLAERGELAVELKKFEPACRYVKATPVKVLTVTDAAGNEFDITVRQRNNPATQTPAETVEVAVGPQQ